MKRDSTQIKFHHELKRTKSGSLGLENKENMADYNRVRKDEQDEKIKYMKSKGFVTDDIWVLTMGRKI